MKFTLEIVALLSLTALVEAGGFTKTCKNWKYQKPKLVAKCKTSGGTYIDTSVDLNKCIGNVDGTMHWQVNGNFAKSCNHFWGPSASSTAALQMTCKTIAGAYNPDTTLKLNDHISNQNGHLACDKGF